MSDSNFNNTTVLAQPSNLSLLIASVMGGAKVYTANAGFSTSSTSFQDISGMADQTIASMIAGTYLAFVALQCFSNGASEPEGEIGIRIDSTTDVGVGQQHFAFNGGVLSGVVTFSLTAASHTFRPRYRKISGIADPGGLSGYTATIGIVRISS